MSALPRRLSLTGKVALLSLVAIVVLGFALTRMLQRQVLSNELSSAADSAQLIARLGIQPRLTPQDLRQGMSAQAVSALDTQLQARSRTRDLARIKIWNTKDKIIYSDDHALIGRTLPGDDDLREALEGEPQAAEVVTPSPHTETASEVGLGRLVEVYVPLRFSDSGSPAGVFEIYLSYKPIATAVSHSERMIAFVIFTGLALLWALLYRIVAAATKRLRRQAEENDNLARYDQLTGLPNRTLFIERTTQALQADWASREDGMTAVLLLDIDGFKEINDTLGSRIGDVVLAEIARRLDACVQPSGLAARLGSDEYALLCPKVADVTGALEIAAAVHASLEPPVAFDDVALNVDASIGIALAPEHADDVDALLQRADLALERAMSHRSRVELYSADYEDFDTTKLTLLGQVRGALERKEFVLHYQPKADLESGRVTGVEALLRWHHPERGMLAPMQFISMIEQTSLVGPVSAYVIDEALEQSMRWHRDGIELEISVNLSARNLLDRDLPSQVQRSLRRHGVAPGMLTVEVTETATMVNTERSVAVLEALKALGVGISIDDFGTGHASIAYLTKLPANELKIDRSFIANICHSSRDEAIVRSTIDLAKHLDMEVVAEGIETDCVREHLLTLGCHTGQGYLLSRPLSAADLQAWISSREAERTVPAAQPF